MLCQDHKGFYENDVIKALSDIPKWTISDKDKMPIDIARIIYDHDTRIFGANMNGANPPTVDLKTLCDNFPTATNNTFFLDALSDGFVVLDIEPKAPDITKKKLLDTNFLYGEYSMSGKGYHLIYPLPDCIKDYPIAAKKKVFKEKHGYYEILLNHWCCFTRNTIPLNPAPKNDFTKLFAKMASEQKETVKRDLDIQIIDPATIPLYDEIMDILYRVKFTKTLADFDGDDSKYEFIYICFLYDKLLNITESPITAKKTDKHVYSDTERLYMLFEAAKEHIAYRPKHDTLRDGMPFLMYLSTQVIMSSNRTPTKPKEEN